MAADTQFGGDFFEALQNGDHGVDQFTRVVRCGAHFYVDALSRLDGERCRIETERTRIVLHAHILDGYRSVRAEVGEGDRFTRWRTNWNGTEVDALWAPVDLVRCVLIGLFNVLTRTRHNTNNGFARLALVQHVHLELGLLHSAFEVLVHDQLVVAQAFSIDHIDRAALRTLG